ncbi:MAG: 2-hydroxymuconic semialdehyde dehydrogenase [Candidatus Neomarinimicrobiota bacterium]|nr:MAG: 2-hydroxymuconic semialdehyde dehydrogenase [Candidatus Neomarinimicrobiota bacterium]
MEQLANFINGKFIQPKSEEYIDVFEPATGQVYSKVPNSSSADINVAFQAANAAFPGWSELTVTDRSQYLHKIAALLESQLDDFADYESRDTGKPVTLAQSVDIPRAIANFRFFAEYGPTFKFDSELNSDQSKNRVVHAPLGVVGCISPWNLPLYLFTWKIAPALMAGNTVLAKPSEITPYTAYKLGEICVDANLPAGVLNIVHGQGITAGDALINHKGVQAISFTGGTATGKIIAQKTAASFKKLSLEMGGKNPAIIFTDCNYNKMLETVVQSSFSNQGQLCLSSSRILIQTEIFEQFKQGFIGKVAKLIVGDPQDNESNLGAVSSKNHFEKVMNYIELAQKEGGKILWGGKAVKLNGRCKKGWFIEPTIIEGLNNASKTNQEEIFGPVVTLIPFDDEEEAIQIANESDYGLSATIWTEDKERATRVSNQVEAGVIWVNCWLVRDLRTPFGGMKQSGMGREGGAEALRFFTEQKNVCTSTV